MAEIIELGEYRFQHKHLSRYIKDECQHKYTELDDNGNIVMCLDCGKQVDPYFVLRMLTEDWGRIQADISTRSKRLSEEKDKHIHLLAARKVESAWKDKRMVPFCPHCKEGISPTDGFGSGMISKEIDNARRAYRASQRIASQATPAPTPPNAPPAA